MDEIIAASVESVVALRRHLHRYPELGWQEFKTQRHLHDWLEERGMRARRCASTGLVSDVGPDKPRVIYRGDIDALPIHEEKADDVPYVSEHDGVCHACGHDVHAAVAAGLGWVFHQLGDALPGGLRVVLQPAEEVVPSGAEAMIREGAAAGISAALALHVDPTRNVGAVGVRVGPLTSATDTFSIRIVGTEGHSARPHLAHDAVLASADLVRSLYTLVSQRVSPLVPAVLNVGTIQGGSAKNVIAGECLLEGVIRTLDLDVRERLHGEIRDMADAVARMHHCEAQCVINTGAPPVMNDAGLDAVVSEAAADVIGQENVQRIELPSTGAEDFGMFGIHMPTYMMRLGVRPPGGATHHLHTPQFDVDEAALGHAMRIMGRAALKTIDRVSPSY